MFLENLKYLGVQIGTLTGTGYKLEFYLSRRSWGVSQIDLVQLLVCVIVTSNRGEPIDN